MTNLIDTRKNKPIRLYNVFFPLWIILMFPLCWPIVGVVNFLFDSLVLLISLIFIRMPEKDGFYGRYIWKVWGFGFLSDILGALGMYLIMLLLSPFPISVVGDELYLTVSGLIISAVLIFVFNYFINSIKHENNRQNYITKYELRLTETLQRNNYKWDCYIPYDKLSHLPLSDKNSHPVKLIKDYNHQFIKRRTFSGGMIIVEDLSYIISYLKNNHPKTYDDIKHSALTSNSLPNYKKKGN